MSFEHVIAGAVEGGLDPDHLWSYNPPQDATYPSKNTCCKDRQFSLTWDQGSRFTSDFRASGVSNVKHEKSPGGKSLK
jgi:hypothetical protein